MPRPNRCCIPLLKKKHNRVGNRIRLVGDNWGVEFSNLVGKYLCGTSRLEISRKKVRVSLPVQKDAKCLHGKNEFLNIRIIF